ncbi:MAG: Glutamate-cysteine ligase family protein [uncultured bacterium]|nr:MAG: Glutamate-cysteine ligase family protein [uncultured bacterium]
MNSQLIVGVEEEFLIVDERMRLLPIGGDIVDAANACCAGKRYEREQYAPIVEAKTPPCADSESLLAELRKNRQHLTDIAGKFSAFPCALSLHPLQKLGCEHYSTGDDRYDYMNSRFGRAVMNHCGMHIHASVGDRETSLTVLHQIVKYLPIFLALSANSPFDDGRDTQTQSWRRVGYMPSIPLAGVPKMFGCYAEYEKYVRGLIEFDMIIDPKMIWWDIRLNYRYPTIELRICDVLHDVCDVVAITDFFAIVAYRSSKRLEQTNNGPFSERIAQNIHSAGTFGLDAVIYDTDCLRKRSIVEYIQSVLDAHYEFAVELRKVDSLNRIRQMLKKGTPANRLRRFAESGNMENVVKSSILN